MSVLVVGAGLAGLTCAGVLLESGIDVRLIEAGDDVGGRVRTDRVEGFRCDKGFQVMFTSYPAVRRRLDLRALHLRAFDPGAIIAKGRARHVLTDPLRDPAMALPAAFTNIVTPRDKALTVLLAAQLRFQSIEASLAGPDTSTYYFLRARRFSKAFIDNFARPFYGGIFLDRSLKTSAKCFKFNFKMLTEGRAVLPSHGMGAITQQLARPLREAGRIQLNCSVEELLRGEEGEVLGVRVAGGVEMRSQVVVLAVPAPEAARLTGLEMPLGSLGTATLYWAGSKPVYHGKKIVLNANSHYFLNNVQQITNVAPSYAPPGKHLLSATVLGVPSIDDQTLFRAAEDDLRKMFRGDPAARSAIDALEPLKVYRIPYAQFPQPPGLHAGLPDNESGISNLYFASEFTEASSQNAAMISGGKAAALIMARRM